MSQGTEVIEAIRLIMQAFKEIGGEGTLAGVILTNDSFDRVKQAFGPSAKVFAPTGAAFDPQMNDSFVVDGLLILRGTQLQ